MRTAVLRQISMGRNMLDLQCFDGDGLQSIDVSSANTKYLYDTSQKQVL